MFLASDYESVQSENIKYMFDIFSQFLRCILFSFAMRLLATLCLFLHEYVMYDYVEFFLTHLVFDDFLCNHLQRQYAKVTNLGYKTLFRNVSKMLKCPVILSWL